jgi:signal transduction histidine kinase
LQLVGVAGLVAATSWYLLQVSPENAPAGIMIVVGTAIGSFAAARSRAVAAAKSSHANELAEERRRAALRAVQAQRLSLARELHDLVSNAVVVMTVQAGAAEAVLGSDSAAAQRAVDHILETGRTTLAEVDRMFTAIGDDRPSTRGDDVLQDPAKHDLHTLVDRMRAGGLDLELVSPEGGLPRCPVTFRVVQESLTNALRHAPTSHVRLTVTSTPTLISVDVLDNGPGRAGASSRGYGLVGITERVERIGGRVEVGAGPGGRGFHVVARIPIQNPGVPT